MSKNKKAYAYYKSLPENLNTFKLAQNASGDYQIESNINLSDNERKECLVHNLSEIGDRKNSKHLSLKKSKKIFEEQNNDINSQNLGSKNSAEKIFDQFIKFTYICYKTPLSKDEANSSSNFLKPKSFFSLKKSLKKRKDSTNLSASDIILNKEFSATNQKKYNNSDLTEMNSPASTNNHAKQDSKTCNIVITNENECDIYEEKNAQKISLENSFISAAASTSVIDQQQNNTCFIPSLEYLINNSKSDLFSTQLAIANIAAVAADSEDAYKNSVNNENVLQTFLMVVAPNTAESKQKLSQLDLTSVASDFSVNINEKFASMALQNQKSNEIPTNLNLNSYYATSGVMSLNNKLINEQIMRTCMGYLDFIKTKHAKERRLQVIRNKISGFILLTILFLFLLGLGMIMAISITRTLSRVIGQPNETNPIVSSANKQNEKLKNELKSIVEVNKRTWESKIRNEIKHFLAGLNKKIIGDKSLMSKELQISFEKNVKSLNFIIFNLLNNLYTKNSIDNEYYIEASIHYLR